MVQNLFFMFVSFCRFLVFCHLFVCLFTRIRADSKNNLFFRKYMCVFGGKELTVFL